MKNTSYIIGRFTQDKFVNGQADQPCDAVVQHGKLEMAPASPDIFCFGNGSISFNLGLRVLTGSVSVWLYRNNEAFQPFILNLVGDGFARAVIDVADAKQGDKFNFNFAPQAEGSTFDGSETTFDVIGNLK